MRARHDMTGQAKRCHRLAPCRRKSECVAGGRGWMGWKTGWWWNGRRRLKPAGGKVGDDLGGNKNSCVSRLGGLGQGRDGAAEDRAHARAHAHARHPFEDSGGIEPRISAKVRHHRCNG
jgi:hypothetical protein